MRIYFNRANDNILVFLLIETKEAVENLEAIGAVPGVDVLYIGMWDLCLSMGLNPLHLPHPETDAVIERALAVGREVGVAIGFGESTPEGLQRRQAQGFTVLGYGPDYYPAFTGSPRRFGRSSSGHRGRDIVQGLSEIWLSPRGHYIIAEVDTTLPTKKCIRYQCFKC